MNHRNLCVIGANFLKNRCSEKSQIIFVEIISQAPETPDVFGMNSSNTFLIECKMSRSDFLADKKKFSRIYPHQGVGDFRYYLCPTGIIKPEDLPEKWGLIWTTEKGKTTVIKEILHGNVQQDNANRFEKNHEYERRIMYSALRRISPNFFLNRS